MTYATIDYDVAIGVGRLVLKRPDKLNSFNELMHQEVARAVRQAEQDNAVRVLLLTGAGRGFCAGQDLGDRKVEPGADPVDLGFTLEHYYNPLIRRLQAMEKPILCAVNGVAAGAGANLALACDVVVATESAKFIQSFSRIGLVPDSGGTYFLPRLVGHARAMGLALLGDTVSASQAARMGLIYQCVADDDFTDHVEKMAARLAQAPTKGLALIKRAMQSSWHHTLDEQLDLERDYQREAGFSEDYREGVAAFLAKRAPKFVGR